MPDARCRTAHRDTRVQRAAQQSIGCIAELTGVGDAATLVIDDLHELNVPGGARPAHRPADSPPAECDTSCWPPAATCGWAYTGCASPASCPRSALPTCVSPRLRPASCSTPSRSRSPRHRSPCLHERTEGWAAGLRLAALSLAGHPDPERFVAEFSGSDRTVAEYLIAEMLDRQPEGVQAMLLRTSLLDQVNGALADLLSGGSGTERILLELEDANAFVVSLDAERTWFRYHHLFADLLRLQLRQTWPEETPALHRRAAAWFLRNGQAVEAVRHTQAAGDWSDAATAARRPRVQHDAGREGADHPGAAAGLP